MIVSHRSSHRKWNMPSRVPPCGWTSVLRRVQSWHMSVKLPFTQSHFPLEPGVKQGCLKLRGLYLTITSSAMTLTRLWGLVRWAYFESIESYCCCYQCTNQMTKLLLIPLGVWLCLSNPYVNWYFRIVFLKIHFTGHCKLAAKHNIANWTTLGWLP